MGNYFPAVSVTLKVRWEDPNRNKDGGYTTFEGLIPTKFVIENNGIREADTIKHLEFDGRDFPFDPRLARATEVFVFIGQRESGGEPFKARVDASSELLDKTFIGFIDNTERERHPDGDKIIMEGRDYTALFLDVVYPRANFPVGQYLEDLLNRLKDEIPAASRVEIVVEEGCDVLVDSNSTDHIKQVPARGRIGARGKSGPVNTHAAYSKVHAKSGKPVNAGHSYWDVIQEMVDDLALVAFIQGYKLIVTTPRNLTDAQRQGAPHLVWGLNIDSLTIKKHMGRLRAPNVEVLCRRPGKPRPLRGTWPNPAIPSNILSAAETGEGQKKDIKYHRYSMSGLDTDKACERVAQSIYEELTSNEVELKIVTKDITSFSDDGKEVDLTQIRDGSPIAVDMAPDLRDALTGLSVDARVALLVSRGYSSDVAQALAEKWEFMEQYDHIFRVATARHEWDNDSGYKLEIDAINYLNAGGLPDGL